ncbi:DNA translocase FtsK [Thiohalophilus thiocyanatoxydans]|uniref:DNA translocase FtsK n=1 Tax=Thiohalophilus thiocyanatoxydans TaxID=381308 RepID=A0A4R8IQF1_9GAMM|nr:DNA translocase FtsK [Thiohalophilus thiocyanatoxydans]TDY02798.1 S-DNA-T family DNA segregation ATPase FtsK/SpoIIIE [Thiohalophilus thiocyanatoxydans]
MPQAKKTAAEAKSPPLAGHLQRALKEGALYVFGFTALYFLLALYSYHPTDPGWSHSGGVHSRIANLGGPAGAWLADVFLTLFGYLAYLFPFMVAYAGWRLYRDRRNVQPFDIRGLGLRVGGFLLTLVAGCGLAALHDVGGLSSLPANSGGILGEYVAVNMIGAFSFLGGTLLLLALFLSGVTLFTHLSWLWLMDGLGALTLRGLYRVRAAFTRLLERLQAYRARKQHQQQFVSKVEKQKDKEAKRIPPVIQREEKPAAPSKRVERERQVPLFTSDQDGALPPLSLLDDVKPDERNEISEEALQAMGRQVELKLQDFGIEGEVVAVHPGPVITRFELQPAAGVKVNQITNLAKDLARSLSAISVRVVEVIPGKTTVGLEIPNQQREVVRLSDTLKAPEFADAKSPLTLALGKDISGNPTVADLARMPHLLVAGTTGAGKSVALNGMILSLLYNASPKDVRLILIDPKMLELSVYDGIPHLLAPVVTDMKEAANALRWCVAEMDQRYRLMSALKVRNIAGFNRKVREAKEAGQPILDPLHPADSELEAQELQPMPYIVVVVDELADMMMVVGKKVEELIARLAQKARASGIHLILATQRPSVDVLTGLIKSNIPTRIAFQVSSRIDSRTILDQMGAEQLLGHGDMLYLPPGAGLPVRIHGAFVDDHEVHNVVDNLKKSGQPQYLDEVLNGPPDTGGGAGGNGGDDAEADPLYDEAVQIVTETRRASISGVQRRLRIGYNRAARLVEAMEQAGVVGPLESNGNRDVLAPPPPKE